MIIWLNGTFGAGKTTTAKALESSWPSSRQFDPEWVGYALSRNLANQSFTNFQDLSPWRPLVVEMMDRIIQLTGQHLISVQTVMTEDYWYEIRDGLKSRGHEVLHVLLDCEETILRQRIEDDEIENEARDWRIEHLAMYADQKSWMTKSADLVVRTDVITPLRAAEVILHEAKTLANDPNS